MQKSLPKLFPTSAETYGVAFVTLLIILLGNAKNLLERYGLLNSSRLVQQRLGSQVGSGLGKLDTFKFTDTVVTFIVWGVVGLVCFSALQAAMHTSERIKYEELLGSDEYVHPANFSRKSFWRQILLDAVLSFGLLVLLVGLTVAYMVALLPHSFRYARMFLFDVSMSHILDFLLGFALLFAGTYVLYAVLKLVIRHHRSANA